MLKEKKLTTDELGRMTQKGFADMAEGMTAKFASVEKKADERLKLMIDRFEHVEANVRDIKTTLGPLVQMMAIKDREMAEMNLRLRRVERKVGISN